jgi:hypothetical protein
MCWGFSPVHVVAWAASIYTKALLHSPWTLLTGKEMASSMAGFIIFSRSIWWQGLCGPATARGVVELKLRRRVAAASHLLLLFFSSSGLEVSICLYRQGSRRCTAAAVRLHDKSSPAVSCNVDSLLPWYGTLQHAGILSPHAHAHTNDCNPHASLAVSLHSGNPHRGIRTCCSLFDSFTKTLVGQQKPMEVSPKLIEDIFYRFYADFYRSVVWRKFLDES